MNAQIMMAMSLSLKSRQICQCCHFLLEHQKQAKPKVRIPQIIWQKNGITGRTSMFACCVQMMTI